jgi:hypothetical protein
MVLEFPAFLGLLFGMNRAELARGPLLQVDEAQRVLTLFRDDQKIEFDEIEAIFLLNGWYKGNGGWEHVAGMTLIVRSGDDRLGSIPVVQHKDVRAAKVLAVRVADRIGSTLWCTKLRWGQRQARSGRRG